MKQKEIDSFNKKVVVDSQVFKVNTRVSVPHNVDKFHNIRQDEIVKKPGFRLSKKRVKGLTERQVSARQESPMMPVSQFSQESYIQNEHGHKALTSMYPDTSKTPRNRDGSPVTFDFRRYTKGDVSNQGTVVKTKIQPLSLEQKTGPRWGGRSMSITPGVKLPAL